VDTSLFPVEMLVFNTDFTGYAAGNFNESAFTWAVTDDTLTLVFEKNAVGLQFEVLNDRTLSIRQRADNVRFSKISADNNPFGGNHDQN